MNGQQTYNRDTFIVQMTLGELLDAIDAHLAGALQQVEQQAASTAPAPQAAPTAEGEEDGLPF